MSSTPYQNRSPRLHRGELPLKRSHRPFLRYLEALSEQGSSSAADDVSYIQRARNVGLGCDNDDPEYHERYGGWKRRAVQSQRYKSIMPDNRRKLSVNIGGGNAKLW